MKTLTLWFAPVTHPKTGKVVWLQVSRAGHLGPAAQKVFGVAQVPEWFEGSGPSFTAARNLATTGEGIRRTPDSAPPARSRKEGGPLFGGPVLIDDAGLPVIMGTPVSEGWRVRYFNASPDPTFVAPDGTPFEYAPSNGRADLIVDLTATGWGRQRLRRSRNVEQQPVFAPAWEVPKEVSSKPSQPAPKAKKRAAVKGKNRKGGATKAKAPAQGQRHRRASKRGVKS